MWPRPCARRVAPVHVGDGELHQVAARDFGLEQLVLEVGLLACCRDSRRGRWNCHASTMAQEAAGCHKSRSANVDSIARGQLVELDGALEVDSYARAIVAERLWRLVS